jgi:hypothetical protein
VRKWGAQVRGVSIREFARLDGCSESLVRKGIANGQLTKLANGRLNPALARTPWRQGNVGGPERQKSEKPPSSPAAAGEQDEVEGDEAGLDPSGLEGVFKTKLAADRFNAAYAGALKKLEFDLRSGKVVLVEDVAVQIGELLRSVRSQLMALPATIAPLVATLRSPAEVRAVLEREIAAALESLANAGANADNSSESDVRGAVPVPPRPGGAPG